MGMSDLPEMYDQNLRVQPEDCGHTFQANHKCPYYSFYVTLPLRLIALMPIRVHPLGSLYRHAERSDYGYAASNIVATIVTINGPIPESPVGQISWKMHHFTLFED